MLKVFVDTSAFVSLLVQTESSHRKIVSQYKSYSASNTFYYTNNFVLSETYTRILTAFGPHQLKTTVEKVAQLETDGGLQVFTIDPSLFNKSQTAMLKFSDHGLSFTDSTIYVCIKEFKLDEVFTLDSDFKKVGLFVAPPAST